MRGTRRLARTRRSSTQVIAGIARSSGKVAEPATLIHTLDPGPAPARGRGQGRGSGKRKGAQRVPLLFVRLAARVDPYSCIAQKLGTAASGVFMLYAASVLQRQLPVAGLLSSNDVS